MDSIKVGVVGLGNMGLGMAATVARKGYPVSGYDVNEARRTAAEAQGVTFCADLKRLLSDAPAIISQARAPNLSSSTLPMGAHSRSMATPARGLCKPRWTRRDPLVRQA